MAFYDNGRGTVSYVAVVIDSDGDPLCGYGPFSSEKAAEEWPMVPGVTGDIVIVPVYEEPEWDTE